MYDLLISEHETQPLFDCGAPLLAQIAEELRAAYPAIFGSHPLLHHWAFKYDSTMAGIRGACGFRRRERKFLDHAR